MDNRPSLYYLRPTFPDLDFLGLIRVNGQKCRFRKRRKHSAFSPRCLSSRAGRRLGSPNDSRVFSFSQTCRVESRGINRPRNRFARSLAEEETPFLSNADTRTDATGNQALLLLLRGCRERFPDS